MSNIQKSYELARELYAEYGVDTDAAIKLADETAVSMHCWQGDDVGGFESADKALTGGIQVTGNYPGKARSLDELRDDISEMLDLIPGKTKINLHAIYLDNGGKFVDRDQIEPCHFKSWVDFAKEKGISLDFNSSFFSHEKSDEGTLTSADEGIRAFWIEHGKRSRKISEYFGRELGTASVTNHWIPDGDKEMPLDSLAPRLRLLDSLNQMFTEKINSKYHIDSVESKLFGIGSEAYVPGSHEFYMGYAVQNPDVLLTLDAGHYHPTEVISAKISSLLCFVDQLLLHVSRPVRWDSDHVVLFDDETRQIMREIIRAKALNRVFIATDYFDASINRIAAWTIGARNTRKALLSALLEPVDYLQKLEKNGDKSARLLLTQEMLTMPFGAVWNYYCESQNKPTGSAYLEEIRTYEKNILSKRGN